MTALAATQLFAGSEHQAFTLTGTAPVVLAIHGFMGTPAELRPLAGSLADLGAAVTAPLLPGFGVEVPRLATVTASEWLNCALQSWQQVRARSSGASVLLGFSMGAAIAVQIAALAPPDRLVLIAPFTRLLPGDWRVPFLPLARRVVKELRPFAKADFRDPSTRKVFKAMNPALDLDDPAVQAALRDVRLPLAALNELRETGRSALRTARCVRCPVLVIQGFDDRTVPPWTTRQLVERFAGRVTLIEVPGDHHLIRLDHPSAEIAFRLIGQYVTGGLA